MGIQNQDGALYMATGIDNTGMYKGKQEAMGIIRSMASEVTSFDIFAGIGTSAAIAFAQAAKSSYDFAKEYQKSMKEVATISSEISSNLSAYQQSLINLTTEIPISANDSAKALYGIVSAGYDGADGLKMLEISAKAAVGGVTDTATAADGMTSIMNAYKISMSDAEKVSDQLFTTVRLGKTTFGEISSSISQAAPAAAAYGVELDQLLGALASITKTGTPTAQAMTQIRAAIQATSNYLGDAAFEGRSFQETLQLLYNEAGGSATKLKEMLGTDEALAAVLKLTGTNAKGAAEDLLAVGNAAGASEDAFKKMVDTADSQLTLLSNNITAALLPMGTEILKKVQDVAQALNEAFANGNIEKSIQRIEDLVLISASAWGSYKVAVLAAAVAENIRYQSTLAHMAGMTKMQVVIDVVKSKTAALNALLMKNPYAIVTAGIVALGVALYRMAKQGSDAMVEIKKSVAETVAKEKTQMEMLMAIAKDETVAKEKRISAIKELNSISPEYLGNLSLENIGTKAATESIEDYTKALEANARAKAVADKMSEIESKKINNEIDIADIQDKYNKTPVGSESRRIYGNKIESLKKENIELDRQAEMYRKIGVESAKIGIRQENADVGADKRPTNNGKDVTKYKDIITSQKDELSAFLKEKGFEIAQADIDIMEEGNAKKLAQMQLDHAKELALLEKQKQERLDKAISNQKSLFEANPANKDKVFDSSGVKLSSEEESVFASAESAIKKRQLNDEAVFFQGVLDQYKTYSEQRLDVQRKFQADRDILTKQGASKSKHEELSIKENDALSAIDKEFASRSIDFESWMNEIANMSLEQLLVTLQDAESALAAGNLRSEADGSNGSELVELRAKVKALQEQIRSEKTSGKTGGDGAQSKRSIKEWQSLYRTLDKVNNSFDEIGDSVGGVTGEVIKSAGKIASATLQGVDGILTLVNASSQGMQISSKVASESMSSIEKASVILTIISAAIQVATAVASLFGRANELSQKTIDQYDAYMETIDRVIDKNKELMKSMSGSEAEAAAKKSKDLINSQIEAARKLGSEYLKSNAKNSHSYGYKTEKMLKQYESVMRQYGYRYGDKGQGLFDMSADQLKRFRDEQTYIWSQLDDETRKYLDTIIECGDALIDLGEDVKESFTGITFETVSNEFLDMLYDMEASTSDFAESFEEYMRKAMIRSMFNANYKNKLEEWYDLFSESMSDDVISETEKARLDALKQAIIDGAKGEVDAINAQFGSSRSQSASSGGFETMSQDTGTELNGRFTALQITGEDIKKQVMTQTDIQQQTLNHIVKLTICPEYLSEVRDITLEMNDKMDTAVKHLSELPKQTVLLEEAVKHLRKL